MRTTVMVLMVTLTIMSAGNAGAQQVGMFRQQEHPEHHHGDIQPVQPEYPRMRRAQEHAQGALLSLEQFEKMARESNPTLRQAEAEIRAANARRQ